MKQIPKRAKQFEIMRSIFLFERLRPETAEAVFRSEQCECYEFEPEEYIYTRTAFRRCMGVVISGEIKAYKEAKDGTHILLNTFTQCGVFGVAGLFQSCGEYVSDIQSVRRSRGLFLPETLLRALFREEPAAAENYISYLTTRICYLNRRIDIFTGGSAEQRLASYLFSLCEEKIPCTIHVPCTYIELAEILNIGRASLYRALDSLEKSGALERKGRDLVMLNADLLCGFV